MLKLRTISAAAFQLASPGWLAVMVQVPMLMRVTVEPVTLHCRVALYWTARSEEAVAPRVNGDWPSRLSASGSKVIVWSPLVMLKLRITSGAALQLASPDWLAVMVQVPTASRTTVVLLDI